MTNQLFLLSECTCNIEGSSCMADGSCSCSIGYSGNDCNNCQTGFFPSYNENGEVLCIGKCSLYILIFKLWLSYAPFL